MATSALLPASAAELRIADLLDRIAQVRPHHAARARNELDTSLTGLRSSGTKELAWESSCLTPSRFPLEFAVTSTTDELRTVVDVIAPEADRGTALESADRIARNFGSSGLTPGTADLLHRHQQRIALRFGAWLGSRHTPSTTTHKVYAEVDRDPERVRSLIEALAPEAWRVLGGAGAVRFVGITLDGPCTVELYARPTYTDANLLRVLAARAGIAELAGPLASGIRPEGKGTGRNHGVSVASAEGRITAVAVFDFAHQRLGRDHHVRERVLTQAQTECWPSADLYAAASAPLAQVSSLMRPFHTALSEVAVIGADAVVHHVGLAPPPARPRKGAKPPASTTRDRGEKK